MVKRRAATLDNEDIPPRGKKRRGSVPEVEIRCTTGGVKCDNEGNSCAQHKTKTCGCIYSEQPHPIAEPSCPTPSPSVTENSHIVDLTDALSDGKGYPASESSFDHSSGHTTVNVFGNEKLLQDTGSLPSDSPSEAFGGNLFDREGELGNENVVEESSGDDPGYFSDSDAKSTSTVADGHFSFVEENGRSYHANVWDGLKNWEPLDEVQIRCHELSHEVWTRADNGRLYRAPISSDANILDLGTGSGEWANELADNNGSCKVLGIDICPMQPNLVNPRVQFMLENFDSPEYEEPQRRYDYIHARDLAGSVTDWPELLGKAFRATRPGGWVEIGQVDINPETNGELDPNLGWWVENIIHAGERSKKSFDICGRLEGWVKGAGFVNVKKIIIPVQVGCIPDDMDQLGKLNQERFLKELDGHSYRPLIGTLGMNANRVQAALVGVRQAIKGAQNVQHNFVVVIGQKP